MNNVKNILFKVFCLTCLFYTPVVVADHASASFETGAAGAIMTTPGATLPEGKIVLGFNVQFIEFDDISDSELKAFGAANEDIHSIDNLFNYQANLAYGITDNITVGASIPYIERNNVRAAHNNMGVGEVEKAGNSSGISDARFFGQYRFYHDNQQDLSVTGGIKTPTGKTHVRETGGELFETDHQPGSGSWDPFFGLAYNRSFGRAGLSANVLYTWTTEGIQQTELGKAFNYNLALSYRMFSAMEEHHHHEHVHGANEYHDHDTSFVNYVDFAMELNGDVRDKDKTNGVGDENSGGNIIYLSPGMRIGFAHHWSLYTSVGIPIVNDLNGIQSEPGYRVIGGISTSF